MRKKPCPGLEPPPLPLPCVQRVLAQRPRQGIHRALHAVFASFPNSPDANVTLRVANAAYYDDRQISLADS